MKILYINNYNYLRGGAESVFLSEIELLRKNGNMAHIFSRQHEKNMISTYDGFFPGEMVTDTIRPSAEGLRSLVELFYSLSAKRNLGKMMKAVRVDVAHVHNIYGRLTTSVLDCLHKIPVPVVMTLHDYKVICPNYKMMHHGKICEDCRGNAYHRAILNRCHKNSLIASSIYAFETYFNFLFNKYKKNVRFFISPSKFLKAKLVEFGWPDSQIEYLPNFISVMDFEPNFFPGNYFLYIGRLSSEKGIATLINAFKKLRATDVRLKIVGEGPLGADLKKMADTDDRISFSGYLSGASLEAITKNALAVVVPSEWYENAPLSIIEAMAYGKPVIGSEIGGIPEMIDEGDNGFLFESGNGSDLYQRLSTVLAMNKDALIQMGTSARQKVEREYNAELHYSRLMALYKRAQSDF
jgi:glycosyltransferase involved in cell wall biosynthesis